MLGEIREIFDREHGKHKAEPLRGVQQFTVAEIAELFHKDVRTVEQYRNFADTESEGVNLNYLYGTEKRHNCP